MNIRVIVACASDAALLGTCGYALVRGGRPERRGAIVNLIGWTVTIGIRLAVPSAWKPGHVAVTMIDLGVMASFFWLAVATSRFWPIWAFGFALANIFATVAAALLPRVPLLAYHSGLGIYADLALGSLAVGTWRQASGRQPNSSAAASGIRDVHR